jgi:uncharacterized protein (TIGR02611 family)
VIALGIVLLPLPGPGWAIIFLGLGIWATEFDWAKSLLRTVRELVARWVAWIQRQSRPRQILAGASGVIVVGAVAAGAYLITT